jgi:NADP-dependent 3-hydroxy acid dehydrogenase YdfG
MSLLKNKIAVVTGGSSGIGLATAKRFVEEGAYVFIAGRRQADLDKVVAEIGTNITAVKTDTSNPTPAVGHIVREKDRMRFVAAEEQSDGQ